MTLVHPSQKTQAGKRTKKQPKQAAHQRHMPHDGLIGGWQDDEKDVGSRREMITRIVRLLEQRKPDAPKEWLKKLPGMARRLEKSLYISAQTMEEYLDRNTLKQRLQRLAMNVGMTTKKVQEAQQAASQAKLAEKQNQPPPDPVHPRCEVVNMELVNPALGNLSSQTHAGEAMVCDSLEQGLSLPHPGQAEASWAAQHVPGLPSWGAAAADGWPDSPILTYGQNQQTHQEQVVQHQQQRLLLLRHATKCQEEEGKCSVLPFCASLKRLWNHITSCDDRKCLVPHCLSSRYVLSHYHRCKDDRCHVCGPVRESIQHGEYAPKKRESEQEAPVLPNAQNSPSKRRKVSAEPGEGRSALRAKCLECMRGVESHQFAWVFGSAVDPYALGLPDYFDVVKRPMDLGTVKENVEKGQYTTPEGFASDVCLTFENAMLYNSEGSDVFRFAKEMKEIFERDFRTLHPHIQMDSLSNWKKPAESHPDTVAKKNPPETKEDPNEMDKDEPQSGKEEKLEEAASVPPGPPPNPKRISSTASSGSRDGKLAATVAARNRDNNNAIKR